MPSDYYVEWLEKLALCNVVKSLPSIIEIDFDGNLKVQIKTYDIKPEILKGVNGYGQPLDCKGVRINEV